MLQTRDETLTGVDSRTIETDRLETHLIESGDAVGEGRRSSSCTGTSLVALFEDTIAALPDDHHAIAPDLRGYGDSETKPVDATDGLGDFRRDLRAPSSESTALDP